MAVTFSFPSIGTITDSITLRGPDIGDREILNSFAVIRKSIGGQSIRGRNNNWIYTLTLFLPFSQLTLSKVEEFKTFLDLVAGKEIKLLTHYGQIYRGYITNPETQFVTNVDPHGNECGGFATDIEFLTINPTVGYIDPASTQNCEQESSEQDYDDQPDSAAILIEGPIPLALLTEDGEELLIE